MYIRSPVEIHSPPHRLSTTPEDLNYAIYAITYVDTIREIMNRIENKYNSSVLPHQKIMNV
ncbi:hypothetical protein T11_3609 [Trichinella zimbabwensis]|uniref:Uncharacterized protein n=1 Tax=Trichinella zimbabwensis TaxID=268475 RepID=A0A0V1HBT6_9BILA|nr:hypothetical protein T11_3609 [Trichinella zimbabwensis]